MTDPQGIVSETEIGRGPLHNTLVHRSDGARLLIPRERIGSYPVSVTDWLVHWSQRAPARVLLGQRDAVGHWSTVTYAEALRRARSIGGALVRAGLSSERPIVILSGNSIEHQLLALAAMYVGVPYAPVSPSYSLAEGGLEKLRHILTLLTPGLVATFGAENFSRALSLPELEGTRVVRGVAELESLGNPLDADSARSDVTADSIAKFLLTSGSTATPKAVITTQRMLASNQAMIQQALPFLAAEAPVLVDWLPWNHVFGGSHNVGIALTHGGSLYIDEGRPTPGDIAQTVRNLRQIAPTVYFNVPKGFEALIPHLRADAALRGSFFSRLRANFVAGAGLSQVTWDALDELAIGATGRHIPTITGLGATETAPAVTFATLAARSAGAIGLPAAGSLVKLAPVEGKLELRVKGPNVMPGYWRQPELTAASFDDEGFYRMGDAVRLAGVSEPVEGLIFDGRLAEDFKLSSGTWVSVGPLRARLREALAPLVQDVVIAGLNREYVCALLFLDAAGCSMSIAGVAGSASPRDLARHEPLRTEIARRLAAFSRAHPASSMRVERALLMELAPSPAQGEITDKGSLNQHVVLKNREAAVDALYSESPPPEIIVVMQEV